MSMKKQRYLLSLLCAIAMLYYALPQLPFASGNMGQLFAIVWFSFALFVIGGNLSAILFQQEVTKSKVKKKVPTEKQRKVRSYH